MDPFIVNYINFYFSSIGHDEIFNIYLISTKVIVSCLNISINILAIDTFTKYITTPFSIKINR